MTGNGYECPEVVYELCTSCPHATYTSNSVTGNGYELSSVRYSSIADQLVAMTGNPIAIASTMGL